MTSLDELREQLDWTAWQYLHGDLDEPQTQQFEQRLETDQPAREALAAAVELSQSLLMAKVGAVHEGADSARLASAKANQRVWTAVLWGLLGAVACLALMLLYQGIQALNLGQQPVAETPVPSRLAEVWCETRLDWGPSDEWMAVSGEPLVASAPAPALDDTENAEELHSPAWMVAALAGLSEQDAPQDGDHELDMEES